MGLYDTTDKPKTRRSLAWLGWAVLALAILVGAGVTATRSGFVLDDTIGDAAVDAAQGLRGCEGILRDLSETAYSMDPGATACYCECGPGEWQPFLGTGVCNDKE